VRQRLRKKRHRGEFQEVGFESRFCLSSVLGEAAFDSLIDAFLEQAIEGHGFMFGGGGRWEREGFVMIGPLVGA